MENRFFDEQKMNKNIQFALSAVKENLDKDGNLILPKQVSLDDAVDLFVQMAKQPNMTFEDIAKSSKKATTLVNLLVHGANLGMKIEEEIKKEDISPELVEELKKLIDELENDTDIFQKTSTKPHKAEPEFSTYIIDQSCANEITVTMHDAIADRRGKDAILVIVCAMELGIITRLPYLAAKKEFPCVGGRSNYNKYLSDGFLDSEKEPIKQLFKKRLPQLFS
ncbi:MAG: hypothetical protein IKW37_05660 [Bacteroidaceae bacterium]|nr:hypothetical protein [Bacteroidaceae bacterium]